MEEEYRQIVLESLNYLRINKKVQLNGFVIMPTHVHALVWPDDGINLSDVARDFKRYTSRKISKLAETLGSKGLLKAFRNARESNRAQEVSTYQVWQEGSHAETIFTAKFAKQKLDYIHLNPVKAGLVKAAEDWPFSSARAYILGQDTNPPTDLLIT